MRSRQDTEALPGSTGWEPGSPVTTGREGYISEMSVLSLGICVPDLSHLKTLFSSIGNDILLCIVKIKKALMRAVWPWKTLKSLCDQQTHISGTSWASDGGGITSQLGAVAVSVARDKRLLCLQREFPFNTTLRPVG